MKGKMKGSVAVLFLIALFSGVQFAQAQNDSLGIVAISNSYPQCPDTAFGSQSYGNILVTIYNYDTTTFIGSLSIAFFADSTLTIDTVPVNAGSTITILPLDSVSVNLSTYVFTPATYKLGSNVVVVWPVNNNGSALKHGDFTTCVLFFPFSGINETTNADPIQLIPQPAFDFICFKGVSPHDVESVRIYDEAGRLLYGRQRPMDNKIPIADFQQGYYVVELIYKGNKRCSASFIKQ